MSDLENARAEPSAITCAGRRMLSLINEAATGSTEHDISVGELQSFCA